MFEKCPPLCKKCTIDGTSKVCDECVYGYTFLKEYTKLSADIQCVLKCNILAQRWYVNREVTPVELVCLGTEECPYDRPEFDVLTKECIKYEKKHYSAENIKDLIK